MIFEYYKLLMQLYIFYNFNYYLNNYIINNKIKLYIKNKL